MHIRSMWMHEIHVQDIFLPHVDEYKYLGLIVDNSFSW